MKSKKKGGEKPRKMPLPVIEPVAAPRQLRITPQEAAEEFRIRIAMIGQDFSHDPGMMRYREALIIGLAAMEDKFNIEYEEESE